MEGQPSRPETTEPPEYGWRQHSGVYSGICSINLFSNHERGAPHRFQISYSDDKGTLEPITESQRKDMSVPDCKGPLEKISYDGLFVIEKYIEIEDSEFQTFRAYFLDGEFKYASRHQPAFADVGPLSEDFHTLDDFKARIQRYFELEDYDQFMTFFINSDLPETHRHAVKSLLE